MIGYKFMHNENFQSAVSYVVGTAPVAALTQVDADAALHSVALVAQDVAIVLGCLVVFVRLVYDVTRLLRYLTKPRKSHE